MFGIKICNSIGLTVIAIGMAATSVFAEDFDSKGLLQEMSSELAGLDRFILKGDAYADARLDAGQIIEHSAMVTLHFDRDAGSIRVINRDSENTKKIYFNDGSLNVYSKAENFYAHTDIPKGVESMLDFAVNEVGIESPVLDFVSMNVADDLLHGSDEVGYLGTSLIRDKIYHHIGVRSPDVDVQIWIPTEGPKLPGKMVISSKWEGGAPRFVAFFTWDTNPEFSPDLFKFEPPEGAVEVEFLLDQQL